MASSSSLNVDPSKFLSPGLSEENMTKSKTTVTTRCPDPVLVQMLLEGTHADITLKGRGSSEQAHKSVLATVSPEFSAMFNFNMREHLTSTVDITDMGIDTLQLFLLVYISSKRPNPAILELSEVVDRRFEQVFEAANKYQVVSRLSAVIARALPRNLTPENCWDFYHKCKIGSSAEHVDTCHRYILRNFEKVSASKSVIVDMGRNPALVQSFMILYAGEDSESE